MEAIFDTSDQDWEGYIIRLCVTVKKKKNHPIHLFAAADGVVYLVGNQVPTNNSTATATTAAAATAATTATAVVVDDGTTHSLL